ncbi:MAG: universal stress protein [Alphaproteobacteria bacterium]|nr:universal stress protein [Alphaproteobacteria bacterium]
MSAAVSRKLSNSFEGALAGGGDPATSPLYVFGPFLKLIVLAGVARVTFGATVWLAVLTVIMVSAMYRQVMIWVTDGSGGSGLSEEEFGGWAVKINAGITIVEYTLTFLVSMAALVTFIADRLPMLNDAIAGFQYRALLAVILSVLTGWVVNLGPKVTVRAFGPATAAILLLLWGMIFATVYKTGFHLPDLNFQAFSLAKSGPHASSYLNLTFAGYARILALMTGIEVFANLVAGYEGNRAERSRKAFGSLVIIMGTTVLSMLIIGPAIFAHADPLNGNVSVFTQVMDFLLPPVFSYAGTLIGVAVLLSACAAAAQGIQNLTLGLRFRHYIPPKLGSRNRHGVADKPIWIMVAVAALCFLGFGTGEDTYLTLYATGVFVLLSMTGWAAANRSGRAARASFSGTKILNLAGTIIAALLTTGATVTIFKERFFAGAWSYLLMIPALYAVFGYYRKRYGAPPAVEDRLGLILSGQGYVPQTLLGGGEALLDKILVPLDGTARSEQILPMVHMLARLHKARIEFLAIDENGKDDGREQAAYLDSLIRLTSGDGLAAGGKILSGDAAEAIARHADEIKADMIAMASFGEPSVIGRLFRESVASKVVKRTLIPTLIVRPDDDWRSRYVPFRNILVALDGSEAAESVLPYIRLFAYGFHSKVLLLSVPDGSESDTYGATIRAYLEGISALLAEEGVEAETLLAGTVPGQAILDVAHDRGADMIMMASHGRAGTARPDIHMGSVTDKVLQKADRPVFIVPLTSSVAD